MMLFSSWILFENNQNKYPLSSVNLIMLVYASWKENITILQECQTGQLGRTEKGQFLLISAVMMQKAERKQTVPWRIFLSWLLYSCCLCSKGIKADKLKICLGSMKAFCRKNVWTTDKKHNFYLFIRQKGFRVWVIWRPFLFTEVHKNELNASPF